MIPASCANSAFGTNGISNMPTTEPFIDAVVDVARMTMNAAKKEGRLQRMGRSEWRIRPLDRTRDCRIDES